MSVRAALANRWLRGGRHDQALEPHPFADVFPILDGEAFNALEKDIEARGQQEPIVVYEGKILDGRNRYRACQILGREPEVREFAGDDAMGFVLSANLHRRHLNEGQRAMVGANLSNLVVGANQHTKELGLSAKSAADLLKVSTASIERYIRCQWRLCRPTGKGYSTKPNGYANDRSQAPRFKRERQRSKRSKQQACEGLGASDDPGSAL